MNQFKIRFTGGLGDCLRMIHQQSSITEHYKKCPDFKIYWVYSDQNIVDLVYARFSGAKILNGNWSYIRDYDIIDYNINVSGIDYRYPTHQSLYDLLIRVPFFELVDQYTYDCLDVPELDNWRCWKYPEFNSNKQLKNLYQNEKPGIDITLSDEESKQVLSVVENAKQIFCVQLGGRNSAKRYSNENFIKLFQIILSKYPESKIVLTDFPESGYKSLLVDERIISTIGKFNMAQCCKLIQLADYFISPDSYGKYVRNWVNKKQVILCTKLTTDPKTDRGIIVDCFSTVGLTNNPNVKLLGVTYTPDLSHVVLIDSINHIEVEEIIASIDLPAF